MCTAATYKTADFYFGRTLDYEFSYGDEVTVTPRNYPLTLIFTTHYPELLDEYDRNDGICIVRNRNGITAENLSHILKRNDIKKSDAYQSGFLEGTTPAYEAYMRLKKSLAASIN